MLPDILYHPGDLLALNDRLMNGLAKLLNQFTQSRFHGYLQGRRPARTKARGAAWDLSTLLLTRLWSNWEAQRSSKKRVPDDRCYHHIRSETSNHRSGPGHRLAGRGSHGRPTHGGQGAIRGQRWVAPANHHRCRAEPRGRAGCGAGEPRRCPGSRRVFAPLPSRRGHFVAGSDGRLFSVAGDRFRPEPLADEGQHAARARSSNVPGYCGGCGGVSISWRDIVLAGTEKVSLAPSIRRDAGSRDLFRSAASAAILLCRGALGCPPLLAPLRAEAAGHPSSRSKESLKKCGQVDIGIQFGKVNAKA